MIYSNKKFNFKDEKTILKIHFNKTLFSLYKKIHFSTIFKKTRQFSKPIILDCEQPKMKFPICSYSIDQEIFKIDYNDKFTLIKNPFSFFYSRSNNLNDVDAYITDLFKNYKKFLNYKTLLLPLGSNNFDEIIDDELFAQFYYQEQNTSDYSSTPNPNYERSFALNSHSPLKVENNQPCFTFNINFLKKTLYITNEDNYVKLVINLLSILSLWLDHSPLDLYIYVYKFITYFNYFYLILLKIHNFLFLVLNKKRSDNFFLNKKLRDKKLNIKTAETGRKKI